MYSFPIEERESIIKKDHANLYCDGEAYTGAIYLTNERLVFVGYLMDINNKYMEEVPLSHIKEAKPGKTFYLIPNVLNICTIMDRKLKFIVNGRDNWLSEIDCQISKL